MPIPIGWQAQTLIVPALDGFTGWRNDLPAERQEPPSGRVSLVISAGAPFRADAAEVVVTAHSSCGRDVRQAGADRRGRAGAVAERVGWSRSHLVKRFHREIELPPKSVARLSRFRYALGLLETSRPLAVVAAVAGYADQAHMTREFRAFTGSTPGQVRASGGEATFVQDEGGAGP